MGEWDVRDASAPGKTAQTEKPLRVGLFIPPSPPPGASASVHFGGIGRIPPGAHQEFTSLLPALSGVEFVTDLNFRQARIEGNSVYLGDSCLSELDLFFWYCEVDRRVGSFDLEVLKALAATTKVVMNPWAFEKGLDKYAAHACLRRAGVRVPETVLFDTGSLDSLRPLLRRWGRALIKPRRGGFGRGVTLVETFATLRDMVEYAWSVAGKNSDGAFFLERFYDNGIEDWVSTTFVGNTLAYGYRKLPTKIVEMAPEVYKPYDKDEIGGDVELVELSPPQRAEAWKAYKALGLEVAGFDIINSHDGPMIVDENTFPGYYGDLFTQVGLNPAAEFVRFVEDELRHYRLQLASSSTGTTPQRS